MATTNGQVLAFLVTFLGIISKSCASIICGNYICTDSSAYCCGGDCCYHVWGIWWFWSIWVFIFLMMVACGFCCRRQRARRQAYLVVAQPRVDPHQPYVVQGYGAVGSAECAPIVYGPSPAVGATPGYGAAPTYGYVHTGVPPPYTPASKPPEYNAGT